MAALLHSEILEAVARGVTVLTGNQRAARTLRQQADTDHHAAGHTSWQPPAIYAWETWTATLWHRLLAHGQTAEILLNSAQEHALWRAIIAADPDSQSLLALDSLADLAAQAWFRLCAYGGEARLRGSTSSADTRAFASWAQTFTTRCRAEGYLTEAQLEATLAEHPVALSTNGYLLVGFDRMTPAQQLLVAAIRERGVEIAELPHARVTDAHLCAIPDPHAELQAAALSMRRHLKRHPSARLALIVPDLAAHRAEIDRVLRATLAPECNTITANTPPPFEFSLGVQLAETSLVAAALDLLRWTAAPLPIPRIGQLLLSPHFAAGHDFPARAAFDAYILRRHHPLRPELSLEALLRLAESAKHPVPGLTSTLRSLRRVLAADPLTDSRSHTDWAETFQELLSAASWGTGLDSTGFQALSRWGNALDELATLDFTGIRVSYADALASLERLAQQTLFAPETRNASVQIMGPLEAAGSTFDALWFVHAGDATWPQRPGTSPLLSWHLQRDLKMPGTDAARDLDDTRHIAERIAGSAHLVTFSHARELPDTHQRPASALTELSLKPVEAAPLPLPPPPVALETIDDTTTLPPLPDQILKGGAEVLKLQAACGFRAFGERRLYATALEAAEPGMNARDRGSVVHRILQTFWSQVQTQDALRELSPDHRRALLADAIEDALAKTVASNAGAWPAAYLDVQCERLLTVLDSWLLKELDRKVPFAVRAEELTLDDVRIGPLRLTLRVDRVDETEFGDVILDYKTGETRPAHWLTGRPDEPQLPLYAVTSTNLLAGVAFANIRAGKDMALEGYATQEDILLKSAKLPTGTLEAQVDAWRDTLTTLAEDFHRGDLRVRPKSYPHTCQYCQQRLLCRLDITLLQAADDEDDPAGDAGDVDG